MGKDDCIFCKIANGEIPSATVYEDSICRVILDVNPANKGHALIIPKEHYDDIYSMDADTASKIFTIATEVAKAQKAELNPDGLNIIQNNGAAAGQTVFHFTCILCQDSLRIRLQLHGFRVSQTMRNWIGCQRHFVREFKENMDKRTETGITSNQLKLLACIFMLCDHVGLVLMNNNWIMRAVGRLAFPIFAFLLVEGYRHTSDIRKYFIRLFLFALISEVPFDLASTGQVFDLQKQNIFFTLAAGLVVLYLGKVAKWNQMGAVIGIVVIMVVSEALHFDYGMAGILLIVLIYYSTKDGTVEHAFRNAGLVTGHYPFGWKLRQNMGFAIVSAVLYFLFYGIRQLYVVLAILPISLYNGEYGRKNKVLKYTFYVFYPAHLLILYLLSKAVL